MKRAFTLIELLVVISIIALLIGILLPALGAARNTAIHAQCQSNLHSIATAVLTYEADNRRMPCHPHEMGDLDTMPASIKGETFDARPLLSPYMDIDFFVCPNVRKWRPSQSNSKTVNSDYLLTFAYYGNGTSAGSNGTWTSRFIRSDTPWRFDGERMFVLAGDKAFLQNTPSMARHIVNHPDGAPGFREWSPPTFAGSAWLAEAPVGTDIRKQTANNFAFMDGHVSMYNESRGDELIPVPNRMASRPGTNYLLPVGN